MTCVLIHGFTGTPAAWDDVVARWPAAPAPIAIALPGHGGGEVGPGWEANLDRVHAAIAAAGAAGAPVIGYSLGARVALGLVVRGAVPAAILVGVHPGLADPAERAARRRADAAWIARLASGDVAGFADAWEAQPVLAAGGGDPAARARRAAARRAHDPRGLAASLAHMGLAEMPDYRPAIAAVAGRIHLVAGSDDAKFLAIARELAAAHRDLALAVIAGSGHDPTLDQPAALAAVGASALGRLTGAR